MKPAPQPRSTQEAIGKNAHKSSRSVLRLGLLGLGCLDLRIREKQESSGSAMGTRIESEGLSWPGRKRGTNDSPAEGGRPRFFKTRWQARRALFTRYNAVSRRGMARSTPVRCATSAVLGRNTSVRRRGSTTRGR
jgi:hypothetical protein